VPLVRESDRAPPLLGLPRLPLQMLLGPPRLPLVRESDRLPYVD
jgi:hypothetical protein